MSYSCSSSAVIDYAYGAVGFEDESISSTEIAAPDVLASRTFEPEDQARFAALSGDFNVMHMDPIAARRTQAGAPVVHGVHTLLWLLDCIAAAGHLAPVSALKVRFPRMVYVGDRVQARMTKRSATALKAQVTVDGTEVVNVTLALGPESTGESFVAASQVVQALAAQDLTLEEMQGRSGRIAYAAPVAQIAAQFPAAAALLGPQRVAALACTTYLVGMIVPGLHSIYGSLSLNAVTGGGQDGLEFSVASVDHRFRGVFLDVQGGGWSGSIESFARVPPVRQASMQAIAAQVKPDEFKDSVALVVGGSRGLGELTAKAVAAGGGRVVVTHAQGREDALKLAAEIERFGGRCAVLKLDVHADIAEQLRALAEAPTHLYYFATPIISRRKAGLVDRDRLREFEHFYVHAILTVVETLRALKSEGLRVFYPSTVYVGERPADLTEYAMAKAGGEVLCADMNRYLRGVRVLVERLPRLNTDQTASIIAAENADPLATMLPIIRKMHAVAWQEP